MSPSINLARLDYKGPEEGSLQVVIDTPKGSRNKFKYDEELGLFRLSKMLPLGSSFPFDFGFVPSTRGADGDPLDVLVLMDEAAFPGCVVPVRLLGVLEAEQTEGGKTVCNDRLVATLVTPYNPPEVSALEQLHEKRLHEVEQFFVSYNRLEGREFRPLGRHGPARARRLVGEGARSFSAAGNGAR
jgi:inorganic pyrophosphatase